MCDLVENYAKERAEKAAKKAAKEAAKEATKRATKQTEKDNALRLFQNGADYELIRASITSLSDEELQKLYQEATAGRISNSEE